MAIDLTTEKLLDNSGLWYYYTDNEDNVVWLTGYNREIDNEKSEIIVPATITTVNEDNIDVKGTYNLFYKDEAITSIEFEEGITVIGNSTCYQCPKLANIILPESVTTLEAFTFWNCDSIEQVILPNNIKNIESGSLCSSEKLSNINFPTNLSDETLSNSSFLQENSNMTIEVDVTNSKGLQYLIDNGLSYKVVGGVQEYKKGNTSTQFFLAGVANAEIFKGNELFSTAKTLIDSSITIGVSAEDIRAGQGAKLYGKYFHTSTFDLKMTDAMFRLEYIAANVGSDLELGGDVFIEEELIAIDGNGTFTLSHMPVPMTAGQDVYIYWKKSIDDFYMVKKIDEISQTVKLGPTEINEKYCIKYLYTNDAARKLVVKANFTPDTLSVYLTANLYSGDASNPMVGTKAGTVTIKVPRFLLNGSQEIAMSMTGSANTPLEGSALATKGEGCDGDGIYAEIIEIITGRTYGDIVDIKIQNSDDVLDLYVGERYKLNVYGRYNDSYFSKLDNTKLTFTSTANDYVDVDSTGLIVAKKGTLGIVVPVITTILNIVNGESKHAMIGVSVKEK